MKAYAEALGRDQGMGDGGGDNEVNREKASTRQPLSSSKDVGAGSAQHVQESPSSVSGQRSLECGEQVGETSELVSVIRELCSKVDRQVILLADFTSQFSWLLLLSSPCPPFSSSHSHILYPPLSSFPGGSNRSA